MNGEETPKVYLGDGLYADFDGYQIGLFTERGDLDEKGVLFSSIHAVYLDHRVYEALLRFVADKTTFGG